MVLVESVESTTWQSLTFTGENHLLAIRMPPPHGELPAILAALTGPGLRVPGHIVAEVRVADSVVYDEVAGFSFMVAVLTVADFA